MNKSEYTPPNFRDSTVLQTLKESLNKYGLWNKKLIIGVSGGVDSMALLTALHELKQQLFVIHINYGLRGEDSQKDQELVEHIAQFYGYEVASFKVKYALNLATCRLGQGKLGIKFLVNCEEKKRRQRSF